MKLAAIQMVSTPDVAENLASATRLIAQAAVDGATFVSLPEYFCLLGAPNAARRAIAELDGSGALQEFLSDRARAHGIWLLGGTIPIIATDARKVRNASCLYAPDGSRVARYDKLHLFAFADGDDAYDESRSLEAGDTPVAVTVNDVRVGLSVCYDVRFPELYRALSFDTNAPALDLITAPSAFTYATGAVHWELLLRARAVENQCYVIASAQGGTHADGRRTWGHAMIVDPWGEVLACIESGEGIATATLDHERIAQVRTQLPALRHRRL
jgi:deaminated glutathione amidase